MANFWKKTTAVVNKISDIETEAKAAGIPIPTKVVAGTNLAKMTIEIIGGIIDKKPKTVKKPKKAKAKKAVA
tara:strand:+ start:553 stop:768 length:216 start_codon:yes stop_codon:yes gene_type:complete